MEHKKRERAEKLRYLRGGWVWGCWIFGWAEKNKKVLNLTRAAGKKDGGGESEFLFH